MDRLIYENVNSMLDFAALMLPTLKDRKANQSDGASVLQAERLHKQLAMYESVIGQLLTVAEFANIEFMDDARYVALRKALKE